MGLSATHVHSAPRRDRLLLLAAVAQALLTLVGAAGEACGLDRSLKANTVKTRTMSLYNPLKIVATERLAGGRKNPAFYEARQHPDRDAQSVA